uniref:Uncharacterized protein n=1 Tax=Amphimedon queenslandica TaxID=400682 RepID=A0A1X7TQU8_AMPQE
MELACVDVVDESGSTAKFDKKQEKKLEKLKDQPSKTAGLETVLSLAVGCRVILRRNIDVTETVSPYTFLCYYYTYCQGLSLDTAIIDLSTDVYGDVSNPCINEINQLRSKFQNDLPQIKKSKGKKRKIQVTGIIDDGEPCRYDSRLHVYSFDGYVIISMATITNDNTVHVHVRNQCVHVNGYLGRLMETKALEHLCLDKHWIVNVC